MGPTRAAFAILAAPCLALLAGSCSSRGAAPAPAAIRLVDLYKPDMLHGAAPKAASAAKKTEWRFDHETHGAEAGLGIAGLTVRDGRLSGRSSSAFPVIQIERTQDLDNRDQFHAIEIRMKVSAGSHVSAITRGPGPVPWPEVERGLQLGSWPIATELTPGSDVRTYTLTSAAPLNATRIRRILIRPTDAANATFEIESVRLVYRKEHLAAVPSGVGWQGLSEIYRESLVARAPE